MDSIDEDDTAKERQQQDVLGAQEAARKLQRLEAKVDQVLESQASKAQPAATPDYASAKDVAAITGLSESHVRRSIYSGELSASYAGSKALWRIARKDLAE